MTLQQDTEDRLVNDGDGNEFEMLEFTKGVGQGGE